MIGGWAGAFDSCHFGLATFLHFAGHHHPHVWLVATNHRVSNLILPRDSVENRLGGLEFLIRTFFSFLNFFFGQFVIHRFKGAIRTPQRDVVSEPSVFDVFDNDRVFRVSVQLLLHNADGLFVRKKAPGDPHAKHADRDKGEAADGAFVAAEKALVHPRPRSHLQIVSAVTTSNRDWIYLAALWAAHSTVPFHKICPRSLGGRIAEHYD